MTVSYDYTIPVTPVTDECPGQRVFYSLPGTPNSWTLIPEFSGITIAGSLSATLSLGMWAHNTDMYLLVLDDNNQTGVDGAFAIDNFAVSDVVPFIFTPVRITNSPQSITVAERAPAMFTVVAGGMPRNYFWLSNNVQVAGNNSATFNIPSAVYPDHHSAEIYVVVSNALSFETSATATLTVNPDTNAPTVISVIATWIRRSFTWSFPRRWMSAPSVNRTSSCSRQAVIRTWRAW
jgi:hypothetical protein